MHAPHLPKKKESTGLNFLSERLKVIIFSVFLAVFAGLTGALIVLGWIWPYAGEGDTWVLSQTRSSISQKELEGIVKQEMASRIVSVYKKSSFLYGTEYFEPQNKLSDAVMIGSDGWLVMHYNQSLPNFMNWKVVLEDGLVYELEKAVKDDYSDLLYIRLGALEEKEKQFKVVSFADKDINSGDEVYVFQNGNWNVSHVKFSVLPDKVDSHLDTAPVLSYLLVDKFDSGSVVINKQGRIVGIIDDSFNLLPYKTITRVMPFVLSDSKIEYVSLEIKGWFSEEMPIKTDEGLVPAFMITKVLDTESKLRAGDIIIEIDGQKTNLGTYYQTISSREKLLVKVLRRGKIVELEVVVGSV